MKLWNILFFLIVITIFISACSISKPGDESLTTESEYEELPSKLKEEQIEIEVSVNNRNEGDEIIFLIENKGTTPIGFGRPIYIEKLINGVWYRIPYIRLEFTDDIGEVEPNSIFEDTIDLRYLDYQLTEGNYRAIKAFYGNEGKIILAAEFEISE